jgi:hypothetical protein
VLPDILIANIISRVSLLQATNSPATGCGSVADVCSVFGTHGTYLSSSFLSTACIVTTSIIRKVSSGTRNVQPVVLSVRLQIGALTSSFSFNIPMLSNLSVQNGTTSGSHSITMLGASVTSYLGSSRARLGYVNVSSRTAFLAPYWVSDSWDMQHGLRGHRPQWYLHPLGPPLQYIIYRTSQRSGLCMR